MAANIRCIMRAKAPYGQGITKMKVNFAPEQDLHGYDAPWVGGAGKNLFGLSLLDDNSFMRQRTGSFYTGLTYSTYSVSGEALTVTRNLDEAVFVCLGAIANGTTYTLSFDVTDGQTPMDIDARESDATVAGSTRFYRYLITSGTTRVEHTFTASQDGYIYIEFYNASTGDTTIENIQLEVGSEATTFEPYENICPITGVDSFTVTADDGTTHTYPVTLSEEIYRGYVNMLTGEAVSDMASIAEYNGETINPPWLSSLDVYSAGATPTTGAQVVYPITPEEVTATITGDPAELVGVVSATSTEGTVDWSELSDIGIKCVMKLKDPFN